MEDVKKERSRKAGTLTRRMKELFNAVKNEASVIEVKEKISTVKYTFEELGELQDKYMELIDDKDVGEISTGNKWYDTYDGKVNKEISNAREYIDHCETDQKNELPVKLEKLSIPVFESDPKKFLKWKETFERYTDKIKMDIKYDYLLFSTKGKSNDLVSNKSSYIDAMECLEKEFGNRYLIMGLLIDDIRSLPVVRKSDFKAFEKLTYEANALGTAYKKWVLRRRQITRMY